MSRHSGFRVLSLALLLCPLAAPALADGVPVNPWAAAGQHRPALASDGAGGAWVAFKTDGFGHGIAHLEATGLVDPKSPNGIYASGLSVMLSRPLGLVSGSPDRVFVLSDQCGWDLLAAGYDGNGQSIPGFPITSGTWYDPPSTAVGTGGQVLVAQSGAVGASARDGGVRFSIAQPVGDSLLEGEVHMNFQAYHEGTAVIPDDSGGMIVGLSMFLVEDLSTGFDLALLRIAGDGSRPWGDEGSIVCTVNRDQTAVRLWPDGSGGALVTWTDARTSPAASPLDIYAARFTSAGVLAAGWTANGKRVAGATGGQFESRVVDDGAGGAWILWRDQRVTDIDLYFTHVQGNGNFAPGFTYLGTLLCGATGSASDPQMVPDGLGGFFAVWLDPRDGEADVYGTRITSAGVPAAGWPADGLALCTNAATQSQLALLATGPGKALVAWRDTRVPSGRVYVLGLGDTGPITTDVGNGASTGLHLRAAANPVAGSPVLWVSASAGEPVEVALVDVAGRAVRRATVTATGTESRASFEGGPLAAGIYFATARRGAERSVLRVCVLH